MTARRFLGWSLTTIGTLLLARVAWLMIMSHSDMSSESRLRGYAMLAVAPCIILVGVWLTRRRR